MGTNFWWGQTRQFRDRPDNFGDYDRAQKKPLIGAAFGKSVCCSLLNLSVQGMAAQVWIVLFLFDAALLELFVARGHIA